MPRDAAAMAPAEFRILLALADEPRHGHGIKLEVAGRTGGRVSMGPGTLYSAIKRLLDRGWILEVEPVSGSARDERRRYYTLTAEGRSAAREEALRMAALVDVARSKAVM